MEPLTVTRGKGPIVLAMPHSGMWVPPVIWARLNERGRRLADTDWHLDRLYEGLVPDATIIRANFHRYVIDTNRDPSGKSLYPGQNTTGLCPITDFDGRAIYQEGMEPDASEIEGRRRAYHGSYHAAVADELERVRKEHSIAVLYDCHSIRSHIPFLFDGTLPDFNVGTNGGVTCDVLFERAVTSVCAAADGYTSVLNGRFKGGWTTRHYGRPEQGIHAVQMELAQSTHLEAESPPFAYSRTKADRLRPYLASVLETLAAQARTLAKEA
ncbi:N-formylglutamate deformylase [Pelagibacterium nitratireducens]|uniref:N-formylglutamate deformylase n=1 Tax=Pelagibacterium nitratireducens TaxID=1046114 RepID=A0ABZ2I276_9HYPH